MSMAYPREIDDPFTCSDYSNFGKELKDSSQGMNKSKHTKSLDTLKTKIGSETTSKITLKLKPVQPRKKLKISQKDSRKFIQKVTSPKLNQQEINRFVTPVQPRVRNSILFSPQNEKFKTNFKPIIDLEYLKDKNMIAFRNNLIMNQMLNSINGLPVKPIQFSSVNSPRGEFEQTFAFKTVDNSEPRYEAVNKNLRDINSAFKSIDSLNKDDAYERSINTQGKLKFISKVKNPTHDEASSRVSTIDTNNFVHKNLGTPDSQAQNLNSHSDQNFLQNAHKRIKKESNRYFKDERISLPVIKKNIVINTKIPFENKRISCSKNLQKCFGSLSPTQKQIDDNVVQESSEVQIDNYYYQTVAFDAVAQRKNKLELENKMKINSKNKTRNYGGVGKSNTDFIRKININSPFGYGVQSQECEIYNKACLQQCDCASNGIICNCDLLSLANNNKQIIDNSASLMFFQSQKVCSNTSQMKEDSQQCDYEDHYNYQIGDDKSNVPETPSFSHRKRI